MANPRPRDPPALDRVRSGVLRASSQSERQTMISRRTLIKTTFIGGASLTLPALHSQPATPWPERQVRVVLPFGVGGAADLLVRVLAERLQNRLGQTFIVDNVTGAGGNLGMQAVQKAAPDGYTIGCATVGTLSINQFLFSKLPYDPVRDFTYVSTFFENCNMMIVAAQHPARTVQEFVAWARKQPQGVKYGSPGVGTTPHLSAELFRVRTGIQTLHIPFRGVAQSMPSLLSGDTDFAIENVASYMAMIKAGKVRALAVTSVDRWPTLPDVPTMAEAGVPSFIITSWGAFVMPRGTPAAIADKLAAALRAIVAEPGVQQHFLEIGARAISSSPQQVIELAERERVKWKEMVTLSGTRME